MPRKSTSEKIVELDKLYKSLPKGIANIVMKIVELELELEKECNQ